MSDNAFASITPANALTKLAFSDVFDNLTSRCPTNQTDATALLRMAVEPVQIYDPEVARLRRELECSSHTEGYTSETPTEPDTDTEAQFEELGMVWAGSYLLDFNLPPAMPERGWAAGKGPLEHMKLDLILCTRAFAKAHDITLRNPHARFHFAENLGLYIIGCSRSAFAQLTINGEAPAERRYHLNQYGMTIQLGKLEYRFQWEKFASGVGFQQARKHYVALTLGGSLTDADFEMPTPLPNKRTIGRWTLGDALGRGNTGRVFFASDSRGHIAAIKILERTSRNYGVVEKEIKTFREMTKFAEGSDYDGRILRVADVIYTNGEVFSAQTAFDHVAIVLQPMMPRTLDDLVRREKRQRRELDGRTKGMTIEAATAFRNALLGVKVLHDGGWLHRDLKPANIGLAYSPLRSVLLDVGSSTHLAAGGSLRPDPGACGTCAYLAPEFELEDHDHSIDIWAMGIIAFELMCGYHPWLFAVNPWREGNESLRTEFWRYYEKAIKKMAKEYNRARATPTEGYIHLGGLFIDMVRNKWALKNNKRRLDIDEVLQHPAWGPFLPRQAKRRFLDLRLD